MGFEEERKLKESLRRQIDHFFKGWGWSLCFREAESKGEKIVDIVGYDYIPLYPTHEMEINHLIQELQKAKECLPTPVHLKPQTEPQAQEV